jgi:hypothetical protein
LVGDLDKVEVLAIILSMPEGGSMSPELLQQLEPHVRDSVIREQLQTLIRGGQALVFEKATLHIQNVDLSTLALVIEVENKANNFHLQERIMIPVPQGLKECLLTKIE